MTPSKTQLREHLRQQRRALTPQAQLGAATAAANRASQLPGWLAAKRIALYLANDGELDTSAVATLCRREGKHLFLPVIREDRALEFAKWDTGMTLRANRFGIPEPGAEAERCPIPALDMLLLPLVAWDLQGGRLGMGGGFYDRTLAGVSGPLRVGLAHTLQQVPRVPRDTWDIALDWVLTDTGLHCCKAVTN